MLPKGEEEYFWNGYLTKTCKVGAYIRLSKEDEGTNKESESITNQREYIKEYAEKNGMFIYDYYVDDGYTGSNFDRPNFKRLIKDIELGVINTVITKDTSRLGRDFIETGHYMFKFFPENNIRYIAILENFDTEKPNGVEDIIPFQTVINDMYLKDTSRKIKSIRQNKMKQGLFVGSTVSYGYKRDDNNKYKFIIDEYSASIVRRIFNMRLKGMTASMIARTLTDEGIEPPSVYNNKNIKKTYTTNLWKISSVNHILNNEVYIGNIIQRKFDKVNYKSKKKIKLPKEEWIISENMHEPIISKEIFNQVQNIKKIKSGVGKKKYDYLLKGLVYCSECGAKMTVRKSYKKNKKKPYVDKPYFCCKTNVDYRNGNCSLHYFQEEKLNEIVIKKLRKMISSHSKRDELESKYNSKSSNTSSIKEFERELSTYKNKIEVIEKATSDLYKDRAKGILTSDDFYKIKSSLDNDKKRYLKKVKDIEVMLLNCENKRENDNYKQMLIDKFIHLEKPDKELISELIKKIEIDKNKNVKIYFNFNINGGV